MKKRERDSFKTPLIVEVMPSGKRFRLYHSFIYRWRFKSKGFLCEAVTHVPVGFLTDFASIPWLARVIIPKLGKWTKASVVHDYHYQNGIPSLTRAQADRCFLDGMKDLGVAKWQRALMYWAVRVGAGKAWRKR